VGGPSDDRAVLPWFALALACAMLVALGLAAWWRGVRRRWRARRRSARALRGELAAGQLLAGSGFEVLARQAALNWPIAVGDATVVIALRVDYLVSDGVRRLVAEVKTGDAAPLVSTAATRRQLLEYLVAYQADGALLVDVEIGEIVEIEFFPGNVRGRLDDPA
jgi:hypothetical protein